MPTNVVVLSMKSGKKYTYQVNPDGKTELVEGRKTTQSFIRAMRIAVLESKKNKALIEYVEIEVPAKDESKEEQEAPKEATPSEAK